MASIIAAPDGLRVVTPYNRAFVDALKYAIPASARRWDGASKAWLVDPAYGQDVADLIQQHFGEQVTVPAATLSTAPQFKILRVEYIGRCKDVDGQSLASGFADGGWTVRLPEDVLRAYFNDPLPERPAMPDMPAPAPKPQTLYAILGLKNYSDAELIKAAFKRMARQWHPDTCKEDGAHERMQDLNRAYGVLKDDKMRRKYDLGLTLAAKYEPDPKKERATQRRRDLNEWRRALTADYRAPLRCGLIAATGVMKLGQFWISDIQRWDDIVDPAGRVMVSSWPSGALTYEVEWL